MEMLNYIILYCICLIISHMLTMITTIAIIIALIICINGQNNIIQFFKNLFQKIQRKL